MIKGHLVNAGKTNPIKANKMPKKPKTNPIYPVVASGEAGTNPISEAQNAANLCSVRSSCKLCWKKLLFRANMAH